MDAQPSGVSVDDAIRATVDVLRRRPSALLPFYALLAATTDVARLPILLGVIVAYLVLSTTGRLDPVVDDLAAANPELLSPDTPTGVPPELGERLADALFAPSVAAPLVGGVVLAVVGYVFARAVTRAAAFAAVTAALTGREPLAAGVCGIGRWRTFAGLVVVRWGLLVVAGIPLVAAVVGGIATLGTTPTAAAGAIDQQAAVAVLAALVGLLVTVGAVSSVLALLAFAGPAAVVDGVGVRVAVRRSVGVPFAHPGGFLFYGVVVVASYLLLGVGALGLSLAGVDRVAALFSTFLLPPVLDSVAVALYLGWVDERVDPTADGTPASETTAGGERESAPDEWHDPDGRASSDVREATGVGSRLQTAFRGGLDELAGFLRHDWEYVVVAVGVLVASVVVGWRATVGYGVQIPTPDDPGTVFGAVPLGPFVNIAVNNWLVATHAGFSGLFAGVPTLGTLLFNGLLVGAVAGVVDPLTFVALVGPHGVVELPAIAVAGGVGLRLGHVAWGVWRGSRPESALVAEVSRTWRLVVGLVPVFVVAGFVEAFVTPGIAAAVLG